VDHSSELIKALEKVRAAQQGTRSIVGAIMEALSPRERNDHAMDIIAIYQATKEEEGRAVHSVVGFRPRSQSSAQPIDFVCFREQEDRKVLQLPNGDR